MMKMDMKRPCAQCPFRYDVPGYLTGRRAEEIADALLSDQSFACHKTVEYDDDGEGDVTGESQHCAGAAIWLEHQERPNQWMRISKRLGFYDPSALDMESPVFDDYYAFIEHHEEATGR
jgi:hypothetical protein